MDSALELGGYKFRSVCNIEPERSADGQIVRYSPQVGYVNRQGLPLHSYGEGAFCRFKIKSGV
jgi:hypothetical protein